MSELDLNPGKTSIKLSNLTQAEVRTLFDYDPLSGLLTWRDGAGKRWAGKTAGSINCAGYVVVGIREQDVYAHRVAYLWWHGSLPHQLDHIDQDKSNNRIANLRPATNAQNNVNKPTRASSGYRGVSLSPSGTWHAAITRNRRKVHLGAFDCAEDAAMAYNEAAYETYGEFAALNDNPLNHTEGM